ncbi:hypothetical protein Cgig2_021326 [Carnegiea gigantea]|uniref:Uncharacterized protein n=1 Tax=Carnegiea gigantea TaxID=171969 RepID=A0A9Q1JR24_9CARY|nr:hypothetical protein Cgig2_021326 [Carnegiea gigantea]
MKATERQPEPNQGFEYEPTPGYTLPYQEAQSRHPQRDANALQDRDATRIIEVRQVLRKAQNSITPSHSVTTPTHPPFTGPNGISTARTTRITGTTTECHKLKKAPHESADHGQLNSFLKRGGGGDHNRCNLEGKKETDADRSTEIIATFIGGIDGKELSVRY